MRVPCRPSSLLVFLVDPGSSAYDYPAAARLPRGEVWQGGLSPACMKTGSACPLRVLKLVFLISRVEGFAYVSGYGFPPAVPEPHPAIRIPPLSCFNPIIFACGPWESVDDSFRY